MDLIEEALWWAEAGVPVFPTGEDKRPLTRNGHKDASTDPTEITEMFESAGSRLHGIGGRMGKDAGLFAIDADTYKSGEAGDSARAFIARLRKLNLLPDTRVHKTRNGGAHYLLRSDSEFPNVNPTSGVEVKGEGGYIILPPSPGYDVKHELRVAVAPPGLINELKLAKQQQASRSIDVLKTAVMNGDDFHDALLQMSAKRASEGWPIDQIQAELITTLTGSVAAIPTHARHGRWMELLKDDASEIRRMVAGANKFNPTVASDALREAAQAAGALFAVSAPPPWQEVISVPAVRSVDDYVNDGEFPFADMRGYFATEDLKVLEQKFVMYPIMSENEVTLISADPKAGKTLISQTLAMHISTGRDLAGLKVAEKRPVFYFALESQVAIRKRLEAWCQFHDPNGVDGLKGQMQMYVSEGGVNMLDEASRVDLANRLSATEKWFERRLEAQPLGAIVIDTLTKAMPGGDQNSVEDTSAVFDIIAKIREVGLRAPVIIIHHNTKGSTSPRGSGNIQAEPDTLLTVSKKEETGQLELRVLMARSIDDTQSYLFNIETEHLGVTEQGYEITAPVLIPSPELADTGAAQYIGAALRYAPIYEHIAKNSTSGATLHNKQIHKMLKDCPDLAVYEPFRGLRADATKLAKFWLELFPAGGVNVQLSSGVYNFVPTIHNNKDNYALVSSITVRRFQD